MQAAYLGQLVAAPKNQGLTPQAATEIKTLYQGRHIEVFVTSDKALKMQAAKEAVEAWAKHLFSEPMEVSVQGFKVSSDIDEQPHGLEHTRKGALNRLNNLKYELLNMETESLVVLVSLENGIMQEEVPNLKNPEIFLSDGQVWVDRCVAKVQIWLDRKSWELDAVSEGVTTPKAEVAKAEASNWTKTAGTFIEETYGFPNADWHGKMAGKGRQAIMEELFKAAL